MPPSGPVVVRVGANWTPQDPLPDYRYCLAQRRWPGSPATSRTRTPQCPRSPRSLITAATPGGEASPWASSAGCSTPAAADQVFTLTPEQYSPVLTSNGQTWFDYDGDGGTTIRFGDGTFGASPQPGTVFTVTYRTGGGSAGNVPADTIINVAPGQAQGPWS